MKLVQEKVRDLTMMRDKQINRFHYGRLFAHLKHIDLKEQVQYIRNKETGVVDISK